MVSAAPLRFERCRISVRGQAEMIFVYSSSAAP